VHCYVQVVATQRVGMQPVALVALGDTPADPILALTDRPWLLDGMTLFKFRNNA
jgi:hypothetical protein